MTKLSKQVQAIRDMTDDQRQQVLARLSAYAPDAFERATRDVLADDERRAGWKAGADPRKRPNVLPSGDWCAYAEDHGTDRWHEHDHAACGDVQAEHERGFPWHPGYNCKKCGGKHEHAGQVLSCTGEPAPANRPVYDRLGYHELEATVVPLDEWRR